MERILAFFLANTPSSYHSLSQEIHFLRPVLVSLEITHEVIGTHHAGETFSPSRSSCALQGNPCCVMDGSHDASNRNQYQNDPSNIVCNSNRNESKITWIASVKMDKIEWKDNKEPNTVKSPIGPPDPISNTRALLLNSRYLTSSTSLPFPLTSGLRRESTLDPLNVFAKSYLVSILSL